MLSNGYLFIFMSIVATRDVVRAMMRKESLWLCGFKCMMMLVIATLAELKAFVLILALIILMASLITKSSGRKFWIIVGAAVGIALAARGIATLFPAFDDWFQLEHILETLTKKEGYTGHNDMNRLTSVSIAWKMFLPTWWKKLFGLGLGNCDYASFDLVTSPFYRRFGWMNYTYFSVAMLMLETGLFGMSIYMCNFITIFISAGKILRQKNGDPLYCRMTQILSVVCIFLMIYGNAMRSESAYMMYFALSLAFLKKEPEEKSGFSL